MGQIKLSQHICWVFSSSFDQKFLCFTSSKTQIVTAIFTSAKLNWLWGSFQRLNRSKCLSYQISWTSIDQEGMTQTKYLIKIFELAEKKEKTKRKKLLWKHSTQTPTGGGPGSLFSMSKADSSDWEKVNITWIFMYKGEHVCKWILIIYKYAENRNLLSSSTFITQK